VDELLRIEGSPVEVPIESACEKFHSLKESALELVIRCGLGTHPLYRRIEQLEPQPKHYIGGSGFWDREKNHFLNSLESLKRNLQLVVELKLPKRRNHYRVTGFRFPRADGSSTLRAKTVALIYERLLPFKSESDDQDSARLKEQDSTFSEALSKVWTPNKLESELGRLSSPRSKLQFAQNVAADYHGNQVSTIKTDWKHHKPRKFRRSR
jgi:hypothetical protein